MDRSLWEKIWPSLQPDPTLANQLNPSTTTGQVSTITTFSLPSDAKLITVIYKAEECSAVVNRIREILEMNDEHKVLGFDIEWN